jgi:hypothetical protein
MLYLLAADSPLHYVFISPHFLLSHLLAVPFATDSDGFQSIILFLEEVSS